MLGVPG